MFLAQTSILEILKEQIAVGALRKSATSCSRWAELHRIIGNPGRPYSFDRTPWCRAMHDHEGSWCSAKAAQMGVTETGLNIALHAIDIKGLSVLYLLPKRNPDA